MFDIGWSELVVIAVVALIAIGPKELPGVLRMVGQWMGKARLHIASAHRASDANGPRSNIVRLQLFGKPRVINLAPPPQRGPGPVRQAVQSLQQCSREQPPSSCSQE